MALSYKRNSNDFMDEVMRELEVCEHLLCESLCVFEGECLLFMMQKLIDFIHAIFQNFDLDSKEESSDKDEETQEGKPDSA